MPSERSGKRTTVCFDGQNLFPAAKEAFGYAYPNFDPAALARAVCESKGWDLTETRFYTASLMPATIRSGTTSGWRSSSTCYDVGILFSQDQDLSEAADEVRLIGREQRRWTKLASAFPWSPTARNTRGIDKTDWIAIDRTAYDRCLDPRDYRPKAKSL